MAAQACTREATRRIKATTPGGRVCARSSRLNYAGEGGGLPYPYPSIYPFPTRLAQVSCDWRRGFVTLFSCHVLWSKGKTTRDRVASQPLPLLQWESYTSTFHHKISITHPVVSTYIFCSTFSNFSTVLVLLFLRDKQPTWTLQWLLCTARPPEWSPRTLRTRDWDVEED